MNRIERAIQVALLLLLVFFTQFFKLDAPTYRIWDESRLATNAYEMARSGNLIVTTVHYKPDMWNTKPPLMIWAQALCIKIFGMGEWAVRLPSALAAAATAALIFLVVLRVTANGWAALFAAVVLCTAQGYIGFHGTRYGEYDSPLALFTTAYLLLFFLHVETAGRWKNALLLGFFGALTLAVLTKGIAGLLFGPPLLLYAILRGQFVPILRNKYTWIGAAGFLILVGGYYLLREHYNHGYLKAVLENELGGRFLETSEGHNPPANYYFAALVSWRFPVWFWFLCAAILLLPFQKASRGKWLSLFCILCAGLFIGVLSLSKTKLVWYLMPAYPLFAIVIALMLAQVSEWIQARWHAVNAGLAAAAIGALASIYPLILAQNPINGRGIDSLEKTSFYNVSEFLRRSEDTNSNLDEAIYLTDSKYDLQRQLYLRELKETRNADMHYRHLSKWLAFKPGQKVMVHEPAPKKFLDANYNYKVLEQDKNVLVCEVVSRRQKTR